MKNHFNIAIGQMNSTDSVEKNLQQIKELLSQVSPATELICFPENSLYMRIKEGEKIEGIELSNPAFSELAMEAKARKQFLHLGSVALRENGVLKNASILVTPDGEVRPSYYKIHLFDIEMEGHPPVRESDVYQHGATPEILKINDWQLGQSICYDLRFAELYSWYAARDVEVILIPASFLVPTGRVHWEILLRARAIESQAFIVAAAQAGTHTSTKGSGHRETYGRSMIIDPWGQIVAEAKTLTPEVLEFKLSLEKVITVRRQIPMKNHRRLNKPLV